MPWTDNIAWDDAIDRSDAIAVGGDRTVDGHPTTEFLYRPGELVCDRALWEAPEGPDARHVREQLARADATPVEAVRSDDVNQLKASVARELGLQFLAAPGADLHGLVRDSARRVPGALAFHHILVANPQRHGGCAPPVPLDHAVDFPPRRRPEGKTIAVLDTGIAADTPSGAEPLGPEDVEQVGPDGPGPATWHGTMVAGVIARFAPTAQIVVRRVLNTPLGEADELDVAAALASLPHVDIVNASFGGRAADDARMLTFERAVNALPADTLVVASAGNEGVTRPHYMAAFKRVVGVASVDGDGSGGWRLADYSNRGYWVDLSAAGTDVETVDGDGRPVGASGTSFAAPQVAAAAARIAHDQDIGVRHAASWLVNESSEPAIPGGGRFVR